jgi:hypothetical protein
MRALRPPGGIAGFRASRRIGPRTGVRLRKYTAVLFLLLLAEARGIAAEIGVDRAMVFAKATAIAKLAGSSCRLVFSDFHDHDGNSLQQKLDARGLTAAERLLELRFLDGDGSAYCRRQELLAITSPGSSVVYLCGQRFRERARLWPTYAANILIHEELHSLGLEENPPSSEQITLQVMDRCGR